jgi:DNA-directed RNA polymerase subunit RPC12/RpoP
MIIELAQLRIIKVSVLAVVSLIIKSYSERYYCVSCEHYLDYEDLIDSGGGVCPYCSSSRVYDLDELSRADRERLVYGSVEYV